MTIIKRLKKSPIIKTKSKYIWFGFLLIITFGVGPSLIIWLIKFFESTLELITSFNKFSKFDFFWFKTLTPKKNFSSEKVVIELLFLWVKGKSIFKSFAIVKFLSNSAIFAFNMSVLSSFFSLIKLLTV